MKKLFEHSDSPLLFEVVDELHNELMKKCDKYAENFSTIYITLNSIINLEYSPLLVAINQGFIACSSNYYHNNDYVRLIIINLEACRDSEIFSDEYNALIMNELWHLLNCPNFDEEPLFMFCYQNNIKFDKEKHEEIKKLNSQKDEIYADYYAKSFNYGQHLLNTFKKHQNHFKEPVRFSKLRNEKICSSEVFNGNVKPIVPFV